MDSLSEELLAKVKELNSRKFCRKCHKHLELVPYFTVVHKELNGSESISYEHEIPGDCI